ncbi:MAG: preprotein translocase subunit SecF [Candidatus Aenigmarchaeota archaeon]|nr:preprotein translocase subunit SecF [Candidatus Aenigmarchaeota archaeon]
MSEQVGKGTGAKGVSLLYRPINKYWKFLMWLPVIWLVISFGIIGYSLATTGEALKKDIELSGGKLIEVEVGSVNMEGLQQKMPFASFRLLSGSRSVLLVQIPFEMDEKQVFDQLKTFVEVRSEPSFRTVEPLLGDIFFQQVQIALVVAFIFMAFVVFVLFRSFVPSTAVVLAAITDIVGTIGVMNLLNIELSLPVVAALLTLIGYSVDTDILLTSRLLKSGALSLEDLPGRISEAMSTGLTLTLTALAALISLQIFTNSFVLESIAKVLIIGLVIDIFATWLTNAGILRWWLKRRAK